MLSFSDTGRTTGTTYFYRVQALGASGNSGYSNEASATTLSSGPVITGLLPSSGAAGTPVAITGSGFSGATSVRFKTVAAAFTVVSPTRITTTVPAGAATGKVTVATPAGSAVSAADFVVNCCGCDINRDGSVNVIDVQVLINVILGTTPNPGGCDVNTDGSVNVIDLQTLANVILGLRPCPS